MIPAAISWNVDKEIFSIGNFAIHWYGLLFASSFLIGYWIFLRVFKKENLNVDLLDKLTIYMAVGTILGARLGHCFFYEPEYYLNNPVEILKIWRGGLASHGAAIGILLALWLFIRKYKFPFIWILDRIVIVVALAGAFIRFGNLMNSEIYGVQTDLPWGFIFEQRGEIVPKHPTQIYESLSYLIIYIILHRIYLRSDAGMRPGLLFGIFLIGVFGMRFFIEFIKEPQVPFESDMVLNMGQILSIPFFLLGLGILIYVSRKKPEAIVVNKKE